MKKTTLALPELKLIGLTCRTNNKSEMDPTTAKIPLTLQNYFGTMCQDRIPYRQNPGATYCVYTDYETDFTGDYTYFVGEEVSSFEALLNGLVPLLIPAQNYVKFTTESGAMPSICIEAWQKIWAMTAEELGGTRNYCADFEVYDKRASDPKNTVLDIYVGVVSPFNLST
ncbi:MAG: GyrI-like domain-containing protein [Chthoniobacterales bacterium]|nr:GyrI-like domain-containing protein [Chthoniobacterales bacterium]